MKQSPSWEASSFLSKSINSSHCTERDGSVPHEQQLATCSYTEPDEFSPNPPLQFVGCTLILYSHLRLGLPGVLFSSSPPPPQTKSWVSFCSFLHVSHGPVILYLFDDTNNIWQAVQITKFIKHWHTALMLNFPYERQNPKSETDFLFFF